MKDDGRKGVLYALAIMVVIFFVTSCLHMTEPPTKTTLFVQNDTGMPTRIYLDGRYATTVTEQESCIALPLYGIGPQLISVAQVGTEMLHVMEREYLRTEPGWFLRLPPFRQLKQLVLVPVEACEIQ